jgi:uncharacterized protein
MEFEWDPAKAVSNSLKHGVEFKWAAGVFEDPWSFESLDWYEGEVRYNRTGMVAGRVVVVTYTWRGESCRIISARKAEPYERRKYHEVQI